MSTKGELKMQPMEKLHQEVTCILSAMDVMESMCHKIDNHEEVNLKDLKKILHFCRNYIEKCHNTKEEELLFPKMTANGDDLTPIINECELDRPMGHSYLLELGEALRAARNGDEGSMDEIKILCQQYVDFERRHIHFEEVEVLPYAEGHLSQEDHRDLEIAFENYEDQQFGANHHEKFHVAMKTMVDQLRSVYLSSASKN